MNILTLAFVSAIASAQSANSVAVDSPSAVPSTATSASASAPVAATPPASVDYVVEAGGVIAVQGDHREALTVEGPVVAIHHEGTMLYVARGARGVTVYDISEPLSPRRLRDVTVSGQATGFHIVDGQIWVVSVSRSAVPLDDTALAESTLSTRPSGQGGARLRLSHTAKPQVPSNIELRRVMPGTVEIDAGAKDGVRVGDNFNIFRSKIVDEEGATGFTGEELVTVAVIVAVKENSALAETGRSAVVESSDYARPTTTDADASNAFPQRIANVGELSMVLRPIINAGTPLGAGILADLEAAYWGRSYFADLRIQPLGLGSTADGSIVSTAALLEGGYDTRALAVGLGAGVSWVNGDADHMLQNFFGGSKNSASDMGPSPTIVQSQETHTAFTMSQLVRLGARDGMMLSLRNLLILHRNSETDRSGFIYGGTTGQLSVPLRGRSDLFLEGGGGVMGYWYAGVGVSTWIIGNGSPGSWKLSVSAGGAGIFGSKRTTTTYPALNGQPAYTYSYSQSIDVAGPMVSFGLTRRFSL